MCEASFLLSVAESANPPAQWAGAFGNVELEAKDGWRVVFFYDQEQLDYIDCFISPAGEVVDFWNWPPEREGRHTLMCWERRSGLGGSFR